MTVKKTERFSQMKIFHDNAWKNISALPFLTGIFFSTTKETEGHKGKKAKNILCVPL